MMPSASEDGLGLGDDGTEGAARHRKNTNKQSNCDHSDTKAAYTEEQCEAVRRYNCLLFCLCFTLYSPLYYLMV